MSDSRTGVDKRVLEATGQETIQDALAWIADDHSLEKGTDLQELLRAVVELADRDTTGRAALRRLSRVVAQSDLDSASILFETESILTPERFGDTLTRLAAKCRGQTLAKIEASAVIAAQREDDFTMEALCAVAGLSYKELAARIPELPPNEPARWTPSQLRVAFSLIDDLVQGRVDAKLPGAVPARALDLMLSQDAGWGSIEEQRTAGVPYGMLLAQRAAGGAWLAHRNRTSGRLSPLLAERLCQELDERGIEYARASSVGGDKQPTDMSKLSKGDKRISLIVLDHGRRPVFGVVFSTARDSGSARTSAGRLLSIRKPSGLPLAVVVAGPGWAARNDTADLAVKFDGRLYSERALVRLADVIALSI